MAVRICQNPQKCTLERVHFTVCKLHVNFKKGTRSKTDHITFLHKPVQRLLAHSLQWSIRLCASVSQTGYHDPLVRQEIN